MNFWNKYTRHYKPGLFESPRGGRDAKRGNTGYKGLPRFIQLHGFLSRVDNYKLKLLQFFPLSVICGPYK